MGGQGVYERTQKHLLGLSTNGKKRKGKRWETTNKSTRPFTIDLTAIWGGLCPRCNHYSVETYFHKSGGHCGCLNKTTCPSPHDHHMCISCGIDWTEPKRG
jgi:hypothetical protein